MYTGAYGSGQTDRQWRAFQGHATMYALGDFYQMQDLRTLAATNFGESSMKCWEPRNLDDVIGYVYRSTPSSDRGLRPHVARACGRRPGDAAL